MVVVLHSVPKYDRLYIVIMRKGFLKCNQMNTGLMIWERVLVAELVLYR